MRRAMVGFVVMSVFAGRANADDVKPATNALRWIRPAGAEACVSGNQLMAAVDRMLGRQVFSAAADAELFIEGRVEPVAEPPGWKAVIRASGSDGGQLGERELVEAGADCRKLDAKIALVIALIIDPNALISVEPGPQPEPEPEPQPQPQPQPEPQPQPQPQPQSRAVSRPIWRLGVGAGVVSAVGLLPGAGLGFGAWVAVDAPWLWPVELAGAWWLEDEETKGAGGGRFSLATAGLAMCPAVGAAGRVRVDVCVGAQAGRMTGSGFGFASNQRQSETVFDVTAAGRASVRLGRTVFARIGAGAWVPLVRPRFYYEEQPSGIARVVYQPSVVAGVVHVGLGLRF